MPTKRRPKIGLALGSGGARGWCHIGVLRALSDIGVKPDVVSGASMGALVGAIYAGDGLDALEDWALKLTPRSFFRLLDFNLSSGGLVEGAEILNVVKGLLKSNRIEDQSVPLALVATDMATGREVWMTKGDIGEAVRASVALPGVVSPFRIGDRWFLDGGLTNPLPVSACHILGADVVIAVNPNGSLNDVYWSHEDISEDEGGMMASWRGYLSKLPPALTSMLDWTHVPEVTPQYLDVIATSIDIMTDGIRRSKLAGHPPHVLMDARLAHMSIFDFHRAEEAIAEGRRIVEENAEDIRRYAGV
ncbi:patatin-like phospholipase family protein [Marivita hallyeonensis]|uniref:NTE family protein n=1 Tax=Marivita hallyeonensis TaxID=996342 RepID=A0A1M5TUN8_9RHOB|nr:patatin-like phospholipase family protein [Marivita hallyeonensis]SHH54123.1 NTE family protein [Marivita hallyeonensis]